MRLLSTRRGILDDLDFLVAVDLLNEGYTTSGDMPQNADEASAHRNKIAAFLTDEDRGVFIIDNLRQSRIAMIMYSVRNCDIHEDYEIFSELQRSLFPTDGWFIQIFQLWVAPSRRREGLATMLKREVEEEAVRRNIRLIYTHSEESNSVVLHLNRRLGYREVRRGTIWDEVIRVSFVKEL